MRRFTLLRELGAGARGPLHLAEMRLPDGGARLVALRILPVRREDHPELAARLRDQLRHLGWVHHPGFAGVDDVVTVDGQIAVVADYVEGIGLDLLLDHLRSRAAPMPVRAALELVGRLAATLDAAWRRAAFDGGPPLHLVHGDVRPANVRVDEAGAIRLVDTGIAAVLADVPGRPAPFPPAYLAPERAKARAPDRPADVYGLGATLIDLLTLDPLDRPRVRSDAHARLVGERAQVVATLPGGDVALGALVADLCAFEPAHRPEAAQAADRCRALARRIPDEGFAAWAERVVPVALSVGLARVRSPNPLTEVLLVEDEPLDGALGEDSDPFGLFGADLAHPPGQAPEPPLAPVVPRPRPVTLGRRPDPTASEAIVFPVRVAAEPAAREEGPERTEDLPILDLTGEVSLSLEHEDLGDRTEGMPVPDPTAIDLSDLTEGLDAPPPAAASAWDDAPTRQDEVRALMKARLGPVDPTWAEATEGLEVGPRPPVVITGWGTPTNPETTEEFARSPTEEILPIGFAPDPSRPDPAPPAEAGPEITRSELRDARAWAPPERTTELPRRRRAGHVALPPAPPVVSVVETGEGAVGGTPSADGFSAEGAVIRPASPTRTLRRDRGGASRANLMLGTTFLVFVMVVLVRLVARRLGLL